MKPKRADIKKAVQVVEYLNSRFLKHFVARQVQSNYDTFNGFKPPQYSIITPFF